MRSLDSTIFSWVYDAAWSNSDQDLFDKISVAMTVFVMGSFVLNFVGPVRYGKSTRPISTHPNYLNYKLTSQFVWRYGFIATILVPLLMVFVTPCSKIGNFCNAAGLTIHCLHYFNRTIIYPSKISQKATPQTLWFFLLMVLITTLHGFIQSHHLLNVHTASVTWVTYLGILLYIVGAAINSYHDNLLINLRSTSTTSDRSDDSSNYKMPTGGIFEYVSCANYFGELIEWWGYFMVTKGYPQFLFAIFATSFLGCRARFAHKFYKDKFGGILLYIVGAAINSYHDNLLINLRSTSTTSDRSEDSSNYKIPTGGIFEYVSCANYLGELMEWWGYFMVTKGYPQFLFAIFATAFLGCRARFAHKFYKDQFSDAAKIIFALRIPSGVWHDHFSFPSVDVIYGRSHTTIFE